LTLREPGSAVEINRTTLFQNGTLQIGLFETRPISDACGEIERQSRNVVVLPFSGVFSKHEAPGRHIIGTPSHAVFIAADTPYRLSFPGGIGDRALTFRFGEDLAPEQLQRRSSSEPVASHGLLDGHAMVLRNLLWMRLKHGGSNEFEVEALALDLLGRSLRSMHTGRLPVRRSTRAQRMRTLERVKEAVALAPADKWSVAKLAKIANLSPFHLCHLFRQTVGTSIYNFVLRERLAHTLDAVLESDDGITAIALDAGFADHSHFTARFRSFFGCTPTSLRRLATAEQVGELRKIMTARRSRPAVT
jgi:AraC family transcriptional regulator